MAGSKGNRNALGNSGGKTLNDRLLAARVRTLALTEIEAVLNDKEGDYEFYKAVLIKLAGSVLPRLSEVTGEGGEPIALTWLSPSRTSQGAGRRNSTTA